MDPSLILSLSLADLTNKLNDGLLRPEDVFYSYMEKVQYTKLNLAYSTKSCELKIPTTFPRFIAMARKVH